MEIKQPARRRWLARLSASLTGLGLVTASLLVPSTPKVSTADAGPRPIRLDSPVRSGDLLFRRGRGLVSQAVLAAGSGGEYSHVGLVSLSEGRIWVLHAVPAEGAEERGGVIAEPLSSFLAASKASAAAIYRPREGAAVLAAVDKAWSYVRAQTPFDADFDLQTGEALYCSELVWRAYHAAGLDLEAGIPGERGKYLLPNRLLRSPRLEKVQEIRQEDNTP